MTSEAVIRKRNVPSRRRRDGLIQYARDITSQNGEDGVIDRIFELLPPTDFRFCVDVGAWDGRHLSNTYSLIFPPEDFKMKRAEEWRGIFIESDKERFQSLRDLHEPKGNLCLNMTISGLEGSSNGLNHILQEYAADMDLPREFDFLCIDIDGSDYWVLYDLLQESTFRPKVVCIEFNPTMPDDLIYIPARSDTVRHGASLAALVELAGKHGYVLVETTLFNAFFVDRTLYEKYLSKQVPDTSIEALHEITMGTSLYQLYDGTIKLWGCKKLLWHRLPIDESKLQVLTPDQRHFPFAPDSEENAFDMSTVIDMSPYCIRRDTSTVEERATCASKLLHQLKQDGFCYVRGTGISQLVCQDALHGTHSFLQEADESVRRSCLTKDRARRGYSPMCTENFSSLIGMSGPNDLVRKFRMGPTEGSSTSSLLQPNVWPSGDCWDDEAASSFRNSIERYYEEACGAAQAVVRAICNALVATHSDLDQCLQPLLMEDSLAHTSILTLLGYRVGTRHKGKGKGPLVAAHTDVGVITFLLFDNGDCATLQRSDGNGGWMDVNLPTAVPSDPIFVVNVADCFSELSCGKLPSTLHRVIANPGKTVNRNCCALFVGLDPDQALEINGERMTYEEWRKSRIARAQNVLKASAT